MKKFKREDFTVIWIDISHYYLTYKDSGFELCLETCYNGFDVSIYNLEEELLLPKECTDFKESYINSYPTKEAFAKAVFAKACEMATDLYQRVKEKQK